MIEGLPMPKNISRSSILIVLAACNLLFWVAVAVGVGLAVSREVDLGVETLIRQQQATAVEAWQKVSSGAARVTPTPTFEAAVSTAVPPVPTTVEIGAVQTLVAQASEPTATVPASSLLNDTETVTSVPRSQPTENIALTPIAADTSTPRNEPAENPAPTLSPESSATPLAPTPAPTETPISTVLLLSDDTFGSLAGIGEEMSRSAPGRPVLIRYSEGMLNSEIAAMVANNPELPYRNVAVDLKRDQVVLTGDVLLLGFELSTEILGTVVVRDCRPYTEIQTISVAGVLTPGFVKDQAKAMLVEALDWYPADHPLCLEQIVLEEERATVYGIRR
jgi:hypothetical protein